MVRNAHKPKGFWGGMMISAMNKGHAPLSVWGLSHLPQREYGDAVDIGCGGGTNVLRLSSLCNGVVYGVDVSPLSVKRSEKLCRRLVKSGKARITTGGAEKLPFKDGALSLATAFETVYFWGELLPCFREVYRVLAPDGVFLITNEMSPQKYDGERYAELLEISRVKLYTEEELRSYLTDAGFSSVEIHSTDEGWTSLTAVKG